MDGPEELRKVSESRRKIAEFFSSERKKYKEASENGSFFNINFSLKNRNILGILSSLQLECLEMAQDPKLEPEKIIDWAKKQIAKEAD